MSSGASLIAKSVQETAKALGGKKRMHKETQEEGMCKPSKKKVLIDFEELVKEEQQEEDGELLLKKRHKKEMIKAKH